MSAMEWVLDQVLDLDSGDYLLIVLYLESLLNMCISEYGEKSRNQFSKMFLFDRWHENSSK